MNALDLAWLSVKHVTEAGTQIGQERTDGIPAKQVSVTLEWQVTETKARKQHCV